MGQTQVYDCRGWVFPNVHFMTDRTFVQGRFDGAWFPNAIRFSGAKFIGRPCFADTRFDGPVDFNGARFDLGVDFQRASFAQSAHFFGVTFGPTTDFEGTTFKRGARFGPLNLVRTTFAHQCSFREVIFLAATTFDRTEFGPEAHFDRSDLKPVRFRRCIMVGVSLAEAYGVADSDFDDCVWPKPPAALLREEAEAHESGDWRRAQRAYQEVKRALETHHDFPTAYRFADRELEMRRQDILASDGWLRGNLVSFEALYRLLANYGDSWRRPFVLFASIIFLWPLLIGAQLLWSPSIRMGSVSITASGAGDWLSGYWAILYFAFRSAALLPDPTGMWLDGWPFICQMFLRIVTPFLAFLFGLAVRRRFRR